MYRILIDSCGELTDEMKADPHFCSIPLTLEVNGTTLIDNEKFDQADFLKRVAESPTAPKSACPSPNSFMEACRGYDPVYMITLSSQLSGSFNSASLARELLEEEAEDEDEPCPRIHVFDSKSASIGQTLIGFRIAELSNAGLSFEEVVKQTEEYIEGQHTYFVLRSLETLRKAGRLSNLKSFIANTLNIKPIMGSTDAGSIQQLSKARGMNQALDRMVDRMIAADPHTEDKVLAISHCANPEGAMKLREKALSRAHFRDVIIADSRGVTSMYAGDGGLVMVV